MHAIRLDLSKARSEILVFAILAEIYFDTCLSRNTRGMAWHYMIQHLASCYTFRGHRSKKQQNFLSETLESAQVLNQAGFSGTSF